MEVTIVVTNRSKKLVILQAHDLIRLFAHGGETFGRSNGNRQDELARLAPPRGPQRRPGGRSGRDPVVDHDGDPARHIDARAAAR